MKALSLWQPWPWAIFNLPPERAKDIENRTWEAPWILGQTIAIHAAKKFDDADAWRFVKHASGGYALPPSGASLPTGAIIGVVRVVRFVRASPSPWFVGPVGWVLAEAVRLDEPIPCKGAQGLWDVPRDVEDVLRSRRVIV